MGADKVSKDIIKRVADWLATAQARIDQGGWDPYHPRQPLDWQQDSLDEAATIAGVNPEVARAVLRAVAVVRINRAVLNVWEGTVSAERNLELATGVRDQVAALDGPTIHAYYDNGNDYGVSMLNFVEILDELIAYHRM